MASQGKHHGWMKKGEGLIEWKQYKQAIVAFDQAIKAKGNYAAAWRAKGMAWMELADYDQAINCFDKYTKLAPEDSEGWVMKSNALEEKGDTPAAEECLQTAIGLFPDDIALRFFFGVYLNRQKKYVAAIETLNQVVERSPDPLVLTARSHALEQVGQLEAALSDLDRVAIYGDFFMVSQSRGEILEKLERYDEALEAYTAAVQDEPNASFLWSKKGDLLEQLERYDEALAWYELASTAIGSEGLQIKAQLLQQLKRYDEALKVFRQASALEPDNANLYYDQAVCLIQQQDPAAALTALQAAIALNPETISLLLSDDPLFQPYLAQPEFRDLLN